MIIAPESKHGLMDVGIAGPDELRLEHLPMNPPMIKSRPLAVPDKTSEIAIRPHIFVKYELLILLSSLSS